MAAVGSGPGAREVVRPFGAGAKPSFCLCSKLAGPPLESSPVNQQIIENQT